MLTPNLHEIFHQHHGILNAAALREMGVNYYQLNHLVAAGTVLKLKRGLYKWAATDNYEMAEVAGMVREGVFCLYSAAFYHGLSTFIPPEYHIAIPDKSKVVLPPYPFIKLYYWDAVPYETGQTELLLNGLPVRIYSPEKTLCDLVKYRKKAGLDILKEAFRTYLTRPDRNIEKVMQTAKLLHVKSIVQNYVELMV